MRILPLTTSLFLTGILSFSVSASVPSHSFGMPFLKIYEPASGNHDLWMSERKEDQIQFRSFDGIGTIEVIASDQSQAVLYRSVSVDLERHPILKISILSATKDWVLALDNSKLPDGTHLLKKTGQTGHFMFDIPRETGLSGAQIFNIKIGISDSNSQLLSDEAVSFDQFSFVSRKPGPKTLPQRRVSSSISPGKAQQMQKNSFLLFNPDGSDIDLWRESPINGPAEVRFSIKDGLAFIKGNLNDQGRGAVSRTAKVDLDRFPILEIDIQSSSKNWYLTLANPALKRKSIRLIETHEPGIYTFHVRDLTGLSGTQDFEIQVGIDNSQEESIRGEWVTLNLFRFKP